MDRETQMHIKEQDLYYGCVFSQILNYAPSSTIQKIESKKGAFTINDESQLFIKYSVDDGKQWQFFLNKSELAQCKEENQLMPVFMVFVCGLRSICVLTQTDILALLGKSKAGQTFTINLQSDRYFHVLNGDQALSKKIPVNAFSSSIFEAISTKDPTYSWPPLCTINVYREKPVKIFSSTDRELDLSDLLAQDLTDDEVKVSYIGVSSKNPAWEIWDETNKRQIVERMIYLFEFEGIAVDITPMTSETDAWCSDEFVWKIEYWRERDFSDDYLDEAREIVLSYQMPSASFFERHLDITYYQAARLMQRLEDDSIVSPMQSNGCREMLIVRDYANVPGFLYLDDQRSPPIGAILCTTAEQAIDLINAGTVTLIPFDNDLGSQKTGCDVALHIKKMVAKKSIPMPAWEVHAADPVNRRKINAVMESAKKCSK